MVLRLVSDVFDEGLDLGLAHPKRSVPGLPLELGVSGEVAADPGVGDSLELFDPVGQRGRAPQTGEQMDMVLNSAHSDDGTVEAIGDLAELGMESASQVEVLEYREAVFCRENQMHAYSGERLGHGGSLANYWSSVAVATPLGLAGEQWP